MVTWSALLHSECNVAVACFLTDGNTALTNDALVGSSNRPDRNDFTPKRIFHWIWITMEKSFMNWNAQLSDFATLIFSPLHYRKLQRRLQSVLKGVAAGSDTLKECHSSCSRWIFTWNLTRSTLTAFVQSCMTFYPIIHQQRTRSHDIWKKRWIP